METHTDRTGELSPECFLSLSFPSATSLPRETLTLQIIRLNHPVELLNDSAISCLAWLANRAIGSLRRARLGGSTTPSSSTRGSAARAPLSPNRTFLPPKACSYPSEIANLRSNASLVRARRNRTFNPDSLSSARTTVDANGGTSRTSPVQSPLRSSLSRSHAIRVRVPLSNPHPASALATSSSFAVAGGGARQQQGGGNESATASYDRYRNDASDFARRVRQRYADPSASDSAVVTSLERAGYGSGFAAEDEEEDDDRGGAPCSNCAHARGREVVGR